METPLKYVVSCGEVLRNGKPYVMLPVGRRVMYGQKVICIDEVSLILSCCMPRIAQRVAAGCGWLIKVPILSFRTRLLPDGIWSENEFNSILAAYTGFFDPSFVPKMVEFANGTQSQSVYGDDIFELYFEECAKLKLNQVQLPNE